MALVVSLACEASNHVCLCTKAASAEIYLVATSWERELAVFFYEESTSDGAKPTNNPTNVTSTATAYTWDALATYFL